MNQLEAQKELQETLDAISFKKDAMNLTTFRMERELDELVMEHKIGILRNIGIGLVSTIFLGVFLPTPINIVGVISSILTTGMIVKINSSKNDSERITKERELHRITSVTNQEIEELIEKQGIIKHEISSMQSISKKKVEELKGFYPDKTITTPSKTEEMNKDKPKQLVKNMKNPQA